MSLPLMPGIRIKGPASALEARLQPRLQVGERIRRHAPGEEGDACDGPLDKSIYTVLRVTEGSAAIGKKVRARDKMEYDWKTNSERRIPGEERDEVMDHISVHALVY